MVSFRALCGASGLAFITLLSLMGGVVALNECNEIQASTCHYLAMCEFIAGTTTCFCPPGVFGNGVDCKSTAFTVRTVLRFNDPSGFDWDTVRDRYIKVLLKGDAGFDSASFTAAEDNMYSMMWENADFAQQDITAEGGYSLFTINALFETVAEANAARNLLFYVDPSQPPNNRVLRQDIQALFNADVLEDTSKVYLWRSGTTSDPLGIMPTGLEVDNVYFDWSCLSSGCWVVDITFTTGTDNFNALYIPRAEHSGVEGEGYDQTETDSFFPARWPCGTFDFEAAGGLTKKQTACCIEDFVAEYRPVLSFDQWEKDATQSEIDGASCPADAADLEFKDTAPVYDPADLPTYNHLQGTFPGMNYSYAVLTGVVDKYANIYTARLHLDEVELRNKAGILTGTVGVQHVIETFVGLAEFKPTGITALDSFTKQVNIRLERTDVLTVSTHGLSGPRVDSACCGSECFEGACPNGENVLCKLVFGPFSANDVVCEENCWCCGVDCDLGACPPGGKCEVRCTPEYDIADLCEEDYCCGPECTSNGKCPQGVAADRCRIVKASEVLDPSAPCSVSYCCGPDCTASGTCPALGDCRELAESDIINWQYPCAPSYCCGPACATDVDGNAVCAAGAQCELRSATPGGEESCDPTYCCGSKCTLEGRCEPGATADECNIVTDPLDPTNPCSPTLCCGPDCVNGQCLEGESSTCAVIAYSSVVDPENACGPTYCCGSGCSTNAVTGRAECAPGSTCVLKAVSATEDESCANEESNFCCGPDCLSDGTCPAGGDCTKITAPINAEFVCGNPSSCCGPDCQPDGTCTGSCTVWTYPEPYPQLCLTSPEECVGVCCPEEVNGPLPAWCDNPEEQCQGLCCPRTGETLDACCTSGNCGGSGPCLDDPSTECCLDPAAAGCSAPCDGACCDSTDECCSPEGCCTDPMGCCSDDSGCCAPDADPAECCSGECCGDGQAACCLDPSGDACDSCSGECCGSDEACCLDSSAPECCVDAMGCCNAEEACCGSNYVDAECCVGDCCDSGDASCCSVDGASCCDDPEGCCDGTCDETGGDALVSMVNLRLFQVVEKDYETNTNPDTQAFQYAQLTVVVGKIFDAHPDTGAFPLTSITVARGNTYSTAVFEQGCASLGAGAVWTDSETQTLHDARMGQACAPNADMCVSPTQIPDRFVVINIPLAQYNHSDEASIQANNNIFVETILSVVDQSGRMSKTKISLQVPIVEAGVNPWCRAESAQTDLKEICNIDLIVGSAMDAPELDRLRIFKDLASSEASPVPSTEINSDSIESGLMTLIVRCDAAYFNNSATQTWSVEVEDVITLHIMEPDNGANIVGESVFEKVQVLLAAGNAFDISIDPQGATAKLDPSPSLEALCSSRPTRPTLANVLPEVCIIRRDIAGRAFPTATGADYVTAHEILDQSDPSNAAAAAEYMQSIFGASDYAERLGENFAATVETVHNINGRYRRAFWLNPGYEWAPALSGGTSRFQLSQRIVMFALVGLNQGLTRRRVLLSSETDKARDMPGQSVAFDIDVAGMVADMLGVPVSHVSTWGVKMSLPAPQACMEKDELRTVLQASTARYLAGATTLLETVQITTITVDATASDCSGTVSFDALVVFSTSEQPTINPGTFSASPAVTGFAVKHISSAVSIDYLFNPDKSGQDTAWQPSAPTQGGVIAGDEPTPSLPAGGDGLGAGDPAAAAGPGASPVGAVVGVLVVVGALVVGGLVYRKKRARTGQAHDVEVMGVISLDDLKRAEHSAEEGKPFAPAV